MGLPRLELGSAAYKATALTYRRQTRLMKTSITPLALLPFNKPES